MPPIPLMGRGEFALVRQMLGVSHSRLAEMVGIDERTSKRWAKYGLTSAVASAILRIIVAVQLERHVISKIVRSSVK